ncbi:MAG: ATP/GTP-binding protein [Microcystaceae cyanobacterium]
MLTSLQIENFRGFRSFQLSNLGKINLLVGSNNSGKTSILEAIYFLDSPNNIKSLLDILDYRGEVSWLEDQDFQSEHPIKRMAKDFHIKYLFNLDKIDNINTNYTDSKISIVGNNKTNQRELSISINTLNSDDYFDLIDQNSSYLGNTNLRLQWTKFEPLEIPLSLNQTLFPPHIRKLIRLSNSQINTINFVKPIGLDIEKLVNIFNNISLTPKQKIVIEALQIIDPNIEGIAIDIKSTDSNRGGFKILWSGSEEPVPIGIMGDGIWQLLNITLAMVNSQNGIVLLDEIDSGLHFETMLKMWKLIWKIANDYNIQVFATTHNSDCWTSLADLINEENINMNDDKNQIIIHRIEQKKERATFFDMKEIVVAAESEIEVR